MVSICLSMAVDLLLQVLCTSTHLSSLCCAGWGSLCIGDSVQNQTTCLCKWWSCTVPCPSTQCYDFDVLRSTFSFDSKTRHWFLSQCLTLPAAVELMQCSHRPSTTSLWRIFGSIQADLQRTVFTWIKPLKRGVFYSIRHHHSAHYDYFYKDHH